MNHKSPKKIRDYQIYYKNFSKECYSKTQGQLWIPDLSVKIQVVIHF